ncbi:hypothetical protein [Clostridium sp. OS1-26]|uniref:hypothetical protein n=1 Tax=Clostridium sp. OS1-26 TaxID=3070681 RepID=UPI0027E18FB1|nr:hypothetical protein [Clostridium sp. OS1-26]WML34027.1 hypothetical protein RCG18_22350 [Clostridium sp. OS1-26]
MEYTDVTVKEKIINGKKFKITVRANMPSPEAIKKCAETMVRILREIDERKE